MANTVPEPYRVGFVLVPAYSMIAFSSALEPLRMANRLSDKRLYDWTLLSETGAAVHSVRFHPTAGGIALLITGNLLAPADAQERPPFLQLPEPDCEMGKATAIMQDTNAACDAGFAANQCDAPCALQMATLVDGDCAKTITGIVDQQDRVPNGLAERIDEQWARCVRVPAPELVRVHSSSSGCRWCCVQVHIVSCMLCSSWQTAGTQGALLPTVHVSFHLRQYHVEHGQALLTPRRL